MKHIFFQYVQLFLFIKFKKILISIMFQFVNLYRPYVICLMIVMWSIKVKEYMKCDKLWIAMMGCMVSSNHDCPIKIIS